MERPMGCLVRYVACYGLTHGTNYETAHDPWDHVLPMDRHVGRLIDISIGSVSSREGPMGRPMGYIICRLCLMGRPMACAMESPMEWAASYGMAYG